MSLSGPGAKTTKGVFEAEFFEVLTPDLDWGAAVLGAVAREDLFDCSGWVVFKVKLSVAVREITNKREREGDGLGVVNFWTVFALNAAVTLLIKLAR